MTPGAAGADGGDGGEGTGRRRGREDPAADIDRVALAALQGRLDLPLPSGANDREGQLLARLARAHLACETPAVVHRLVADPGHDVSHRETGARRRTSGLDATDHDAHLARRTEVLAQLGSQVDELDAEITAGQARRPRRLRAAGAPEQRARPAGRAAADRRPRRARRARRLGGRRRLRGAAGGERQSERPEAGRRVHDPGSQRVHE